MFPPNHRPQKGNLITYPRILQEKEREQNGFMKSRTGSPWLTPRDGLVQHCYIADKVTEAGEIK